jgi:hypothetical protein
MPVLTERQVDDVVIYHVTEPHVTDEDETVDVWRIDGVVFQSLADAEATGRDMAWRKKVSLWLCSGRDERLVASYRDSTEERQKNG